MPVRLTSTEKGTILPVRAVVRARRTGILGERAGALRVGVSAAPEGGKANRALLRIIADALGVPPSHLEILRGMTSREKQILIRDVDPDRVETALTPHLEGAT
jgi:uncharacterized protein YggU (UPF0235/DUF167 family)